VLWRRPVGDKSETMRIFPPLILRPDQLRAHAAGLRFGEIDIQGAVGNSRGRFGRFASGRVGLRTSPNSPFPQRCRQFVPSGNGLHMRGIDPAHGAVQSKLLAMRVQPAPDVVVRQAIDTCKIDGTTVAVPARCRAPPVEGIAGACLEANRQALSEIISERAEYRPSDPSLVHRMPGGEKLLAEIRVHAADNVVLRREPPDVCGRGILPSEIPVGIRLRAGTLIDTL